MEDTQKICTKCKELKSIVDFSKDKNRKDGVDLWCKQCKNNYKNRYHHTKEGLATQLFVHQRSKSKKRGHTPPDYSKEELKNWLFNHKDFKKLFTEWENSNFNVSLTPSIDRINDYLPYSLDNIQLVKWKENNNRFHIDEKLGINRKKLIPVIAVSIDTGKITEFYSIAQAQRETNVLSTNIVDICKRKHKNYISSGGYYWYYKYKYTIKNEEG